MYIRQQYDVEIIPNTTFCLKDIESLGLKLSLGETKIKLLTVYKPREATTPLFIEKMMEIIASMSVTSGEELIVCGDMNIDLLDIVILIIIRTFKIILHLVNPLHCCQ